jgi:5-hydroxyisourate hydrolase
MAISTHILDTSLGRPAEGVNVTLEERHGPDWVFLGGAVTDADGRAGSLLPEGRELQPGSLRLRFDVDEYFGRQGRAAFYPSVDIVFHVESAVEHYHVPLLLSPFGYSTYRGS